MKNTRLPLIPVVAGLLISVTGCTMAYRNGQQCKEKMTLTYPAESPKLVFKQPSVAIDGSRVVVEAVYKSPVASPTKTIIKPKTVDNTAGVECTFDGETLKTFRWLTPEKLANDHKPGANEK